MSIQAFQGSPGQGMSLTLSPRLDVNGDKRTVTAPASPGQVVGTYRSARISGSEVDLSRSFARAAVRSQFSIKPDSLIPSRMAALSTEYETHTVIKKTIASTANSNTACRCMSASSCRCQADKFIVPPKKSNRDINGRVVSKGVQVASKGFHYRVASVRLGSARLVLLGAFGRERYGAVQVVPCCLLQVVQS